MKGYRFYIEYNSPKDKRNNKNNGNVLALITDNKPWIGSQNQILQDCMSAVMFTPNSPVCGNSVSWDYLKTQTKRIPESIAREIHPNLFKVLDSYEDDEN